jgi:hypothetical protein
MSDQEEEISPSQVEASAAVSGFQGSTETLPEAPPEAAALESIREAKATTKDVPAMDLVNLSEDLRKARRFEFGKGFTAIGWVLLGAAAGAAVSGQHLDNKWVMLSGVVGILCVITGTLLWVARAEVVASVNQKLDIHLRMIKDQKAIARMREIYRETDDDLLARIKRRFRRRKKDQS